MLSPPGPKKLVALDPDPELSGRLRWHAWAAACPNSVHSRPQRLGPVALPALEDALRERDMEIVYRAERVLMRLNRPVPGN